MARPAVRPQPGSASVLLAPVPSHFLHLLASPSIVRALPKNPGLDYCYMINEVNESDYLKGNLVRESLMLFVM